MSLESYQVRERQRLAKTLTDSCLVNDVTTWLSLFDQGWHKIFKHGDLPRWKAGFEGLPEVTEALCEVASDTVRVAYNNTIENNNSSLNVERALQDLHPWRKGPFEVFGVHVDTEWRSDWKWQRVQPHLASLQGRIVLDVGCGSGYHMWRMLGNEAALVMGIDPTPLFSLHFATIKQYLPDTAVFLVPVGIDDVPVSPRAFDTVFSMGILYHRRSPLDHLLQLKAQLRVGGELVLETLVIEGDEHACLMPDERYAKMRNVWFIPSVKMLEVWLKRCGFVNIRCVDVGVTSLDEQRATDWMRFESLADFLDSNDSSKTIEGYAAPMRAVILAESL